MRIKLKIGFLRAAAVLSLAALWGCAPTLTVNDKTYYVLTKSEEQTLVKEARRLLIAPSKALTKEEVHFIQTSEPEVNIRYIADRTGEAKIIWTTPQKIITLHFGGQLLSDTMGWSLETEKRVPDVLKFIPPPK